MFNTQVLWEKVKQSEEQGEERQGERVHLALLTSTTASVACWCMKRTVAFMP
jgi:hypothetical protein